MTNAQSPFSSSSSSSILFTLLLAGTFPSIITSNEEATPLTMKHVNPSIINGDFPITHTRILRNSETGFVTHPLIPHKVQLERRRRELREKREKRGVDLNSEDAEDAEDVSMKLPPRPNVSRRTLAELWENDEWDGSLDGNLDEESRRYISALSALRGTKPNAHNAHSDKNDNTRSTRHLQQQMGALYQGYGTHYIDLWLGTPTPQRQTVIVDTGSGVTAFPCEECTGCGDSYHTDQYFKQSLSQTFRALTCDECLRGYCASMDGQKRCRISMSYAEGSSWSAYESLDVCYAGGLHDRPLVGGASREGGDIDHINPVDASQFAFELAFGCQVSITGLFITQLADGIMGMENDRTSFWKQMHSKNAIPRPEFSLCFSRQDDASREGTGAGAMTLGGVDPRLHMNPMVFAKNIRGSGFYTVHLKSIYLREGGGESAQVTADDMNRMHKLNIDEGTLNSGNVIVDSGTTDTYFTRSLDGPFRKVWKELTGKDYGHGPVNLTPEEIAGMPTIIMVMQGHDGGVGDETDGDPNLIPGYAGDVLSDNPRDVVLAIPASHYMEFDPEKGSYVMRFYADENSGSVLGANAMMGHDVYFDTANGRIGWAESDCDYTSLLMSEGTISVVPETPSSEVSSTKTEVVQDDETTDDDDVFTDEEPSTEGTGIEGIGFQPEEETPSTGSTEKEDSEGLVDVAETLFSDMQHSCKSTTCRGIGLAFILAAMFVVSVMIRRTIARRRVVRQYQEAELEISDLALDADSDDEGGYVDEPPLPRIS